MFSIKHKKFVEALWLFGQDKGNLNIVSFVVFISLIYISIGGSWCLGL